jgi:hypothetical protein
MMMWFTKTAAQVVNNSITRVGSREGNGCDLVSYSGPLPFQILDPTLHLAIYAWLCDSIVWIQNAFAE